MLKRLRRWYCRRTVHYWKATPAAVGNKLYSILQCERCGEVMVDGR